MCGLAGVVDRSGGRVDRAVLARMGEAIAHRGPDGDGIYVDDGVGFAHRRLAILDLTAAGAQPMTSAAGDHVIVYNGELYNYPELRRDLEARGVRLRSRSDTEVMLELLARQGTAAVPSFNGLFAFALHDRRRREVILARDRYGTKPLYYAEVGGVVLFGSEIKAMLAHPRLGARVDREALVEYMTFQNFFTDRTLFDGVRIVPPGCWLRVPLDGGPLELTRYWDFHFAEPDERADREEYVEELDRLFTQAVRRQMLSDVPVNAFLSGGMDTGAITAVASEAAGSLCSFTVGFDTSSVSGLELAFDERPQAERMSYLFGTEHYEMVLKAGDMERSLSTLMWHVEEPRVGQSYPNFYAAKLAAHFGKVVLSGCGGDEMFGGYPWRYYRAVVNRDFDDYVDKYFSYWQRLVPPEVATEFFSPSADAYSTVDLRDVFRSVFIHHDRQLSRPEDYINHSLYFEAKTFLHGLLVLDDKLTMAHGIEMRVPFLDNDLVDFAMRLPVSLKLGNLGEVVALNENEPGPKTSQYFERTRDGKLLLREALARHVPPDIAWGPKQGFSGPDASWFRGESVDYVRRRLLQRDARVFDYFDRRVVHDLVGDHIDGRANRRLFIWSLLCVEQTLEHFFTGVVPDLDTVEVGTPGA